MVVGRSRLMWPPAAPPPGLARRPRRPPAGRRAAARAASPPRRASPCSTSRATTTSACPATRGSSRARSRPRATWGAGSTGSRLVTGTTALHAELEAELAAFLGAPARWCSPPATSPTSACVTALSGPGALVVSDAANHASLVDACRLVPRPHRGRRRTRPRRGRRGARRPHRGARAGRHRHRVSVDGDVRPAARAARRVPGPRRAAGRRRGARARRRRAGRARALAAVGLAGADDVVATVTLSKALGSQGGAVLGPAAVIAHLVDTARSFIFDTGLAPAAVGAALAALRRAARRAGAPGRGAAARGRARRRRGRAGARRRRSCRWCSASPSWRSRPRGACRAAGCGSAASGRRRSRRAPAGCGSPPRGPDRR